MKKNAIIITIIGALILSLYCALVNLSDQKKAAEIQERNVEALTTENKTFKIQDSIKVREISALTLSKKQFEKICKEQAAQLQELKKANGKIKPQFFTETTQTDTFIITKFDTIVKNGDTCTGYNDKYISFLYCNDTAYFETNDTIRQTISKAYKHKFLWFKFGEAGINQEIWSTNPHTNINFQKFVKFE